MDKKKIIHNIDVTECRNKYICRLEETIEYCERNPNCYFKQLQRKTAECEKLIAQRDTFMNLMSIYKDLSKGRKDAKQVVDYINELETILNEYKQAFDEIEIYFTSKDTTKTSLFNIHCIEQEIQDIISKAKENNNE